MSSDRQNDGGKPTRRINPASLANLKGGSRLGKPNKVAAEAKQVIAEAAQGLGGVERLVAWAREDPKNEAKFWESIFPKLIPVQIANAGGEPFKVEQVNHDAEQFRRRLVQGLIAGPAESGTVGTQH